MKTVIEEAVERLRPLCGENCKIGLILGSGLGAYAERLGNPRFVSYKDIPGFPQSNVPGHKGRFAVGELFGKTVVCMQGRFHYYEGYPQSQIALSVRVMKRLGVEKLLLTNAAGGVNLAFSPGDLMLISDHINFSGSNPLIGPNDDTLGPRFPDMTQAYSARLRELAKAVAAETNVEVGEGVYAGLLGPSFETPAEIRYLRAIGADLAGMSTVAETIAARHMGIEVLGISTVTNMASGMQAELSHAEVLEIGRSASGALIKLLSALMPRIG